MKVIVRYMAQLKQAAGRGEEEVHLTESTTVRALVTELVLRR